MRLSFVWVGAIAQALGLIPAEAPLHPHHEEQRYRKSRKRKQRRTLKPNMRTVSKRVRRKHRRAA